MENQKLVSYEDLHVPGQWMCPVCNYRLTKRIIGKNTVGDDTSEHQEPCPNDGARMEPVTWKDYCEGLELYIEQQREKLLSHALVPVLVGSGVQLILSERERQIHGEGWTAMSDDVHVDGSLAKAAACYVSTAAIQSERQLATLPACFVHKDWPWDRSWWKPSNDRVRNLVKAGALIAAEIDRIQREDATTQADEQAG